MPIYEYQCRQCQHCFEKLVFAGDEEPVTCPQCETREVEKLMSCVSFMGDSSTGVCSTNSGSRFG
ncbi:MAG: zinc ribbon domain-containing protein [Desulfobacterales bacterium]